MVITVGIGRAASATGAMPANERRRVLADFAAGRCRVAPGSEARIKYRRRRA